MAAGHSLRPLVSGLAWPFYGALPSVAVHIAESNINLQEDTAVAVPGLNAMPSAAALYACFFFKLLEETLKDQYPESA